MWLDFLTLSVSSIILAAVFSLAINSKRIVKKRRFGFFNSLFAGVFTAAFLYCIKKLQRSSLRYRVCGRRWVLFYSRRDYRTSMFLAMHMKACKTCEIPGTTKKKSKLTTEERDIIESLDHWRWNAYMRSEGYIFSGSTDKSGRNDWKNVLWLGWFLFINRRRET